MTERGAPIDTALTSTVNYPSSLFSLEKDEVFPYERLAYNFLGIGVEALHEKKLPERILVDFTHLLPGSLPWSINSSVTCDFDERGAPVAFNFVTPELVPAMLYLFTAAVTSDFLDEAGFQKFRSNPKALRDQIQRFVDAASAGVRAYRDKGFASAIRACYAHLGLQIWDLERCGDHYDLLTKLIANHEVAHAYIQQMTRKPQATQIEKMAFELIADMVATVWFYQKMIQHTPNTEEYRQFRGMNSYAETIFSNSLATLRHQQSLLVLMAIAGAQRTGGVVSLAGGQTHPAGLQRYLIQHAQLYTLIRSNFSSTLSEDHLRRIEADWDLRMDMLFQSGAIQRTDLEEIMDAREYDAMEVAANLIEGLRIIELEPLVSWLREMRGNVSRASKKRKGQ